MTIYGNVTLCPSFGDQFTAACLVHSNSRGPNRLFQKSDGQWCLVEKTLPEVIGERVLRPLIARVSNFVSSAWHYWPSLPGAEASEIRRADPCDEPALEQEQRQMRYTIVLTPPADQMKKYVDASEQLYADCDPKYLLNNDGTSSPHITVVQFDAESIEQAQEVWSSMVNKMKGEKFSPFRPPFTGVAFVEGTGPYEGTTWVELSVQRGDINSPIMRVHQAALDSLGEFNLKPLNAVGSNYRPHLTLARIKMPESLKSWPKTLFESTGPFDLRLGQSDEEWQYAKTLKSYS